MKKQNDSAGILDRSQPLIHQRAHETQPFNTVIKLPHPRCARVPGLTSRSAGRVRSSSTSSSPTP